MAKLCLERRKYLVMLLVLAGLILFAFGFVGELVAGQREEIRALHREIDQMREEQAP